MRQRSSVTGESRALSGRPHTTRISRLGRVWAIISSAGTILLAALVPKCPLCVAAMLSVWGVGATAAGALAPAVRPSIIVLAALALAALVATQVQRVRARRRGSVAHRGCCSA
jgi:hypothetical protein